jgi:predicted ATPase/DNA-binding winged helix-turn-helix (wHTH) protein
LPTVPEASPPKPADLPLRFGDGGRFELRPAERRLFVDGSPATLGSRAFDLLVALVERRDRVVTKNELLDCVWPDVVVEEQNLHVQISHLRKVFGKDVLSTVPGRGYRFTAATLESPAEAAPAPDGPPPPPPPRPAGPRLFGRGVDLAELDAMLVQGSVTLVGPSGVGKTSLARAMAACWGGARAWVDLAALNDGQQIHGAVARALGGQLGEGDALPQLLRAAQGHASLLLVLDNAEHLIEPCAVLAGELVRGLPELRLLVTSQLPLAVAGERIKRLEPLRVLRADSGAAQPEGGVAEAATDDAVALLVERITAADQRFRVTPASRGLLESVCTQLDGLPLALEMAAARVPQIGLQAVHDALSQRFALLTRGNRGSAARHRTLHQALEWSYHLLGAPEQALFRALGVFAGGFTLELAVALVAGDGQAGGDSRWDVVDRLATLVDRSLVTVSADDPPRYRLLETMRAFGLELAQRTPGAAPHAGQVSELDAARRRHAMAVFDVFRPFLRGPIGPGPWLAEMENAREACRWAREHDLSLAAQLTAALSRPTTFTIWRAEVKQWLYALEPAMRSDAGVALPLEVRVLWWSERARVAVIASEIAAAPAAYAMALARSLGDPVLMLRSAVVRVRATPPGDDLDAACAELRALAAGLSDATITQRLMIQGALVNADLARRDFHAVLEGRRRELALAREEGVARQIDAVESNLVLALFTVGRHDEAAQVGLALVARIEAAPGGGEDNGNLPWALTGTIAALVSAGRLAEAQPLAQRMWSTATRFAIPWIAIPPLVRLASARGRHEAAVQLIGYAQQLHASNDVDVDPADQDLLTAVQARVAAELGADAAEALLAAGRKLDTGAARALAVAGPG